MISKPQDAPFASWVTGWFNLLGQVAGTTGIRSNIYLNIPSNLLADNLTSASFACANFISTLAVISANYQPTPQKTIGIYAAVLIAQGTI
jgi:hypothetical protein